VRALEDLGHGPQLLTRLRAGEPPDPRRPALVDTIGELEAVYALADLAFVGGTLMSRGGQNMLEPAAQGCAVLHGPRVGNFRQEAALLERAGASLRVADAAALAPAFARLLADPDERARMGRAGQEAVRTQRGATLRTLHALEALFGGD
jgi:3-deoxy-D-manno-octulosonic-acid transferase